MTLRAPLATLLTLIVAAWPAQANTVGLPPDLARRLDLGEVVVLDLLPAGGGGQPGQGGTALTVVHAAPDVVWNVLVDYPRHRGLYPRVVGAEVLEADSGHALVRYAVGVGPFSFRFHVANYADATRRRLAWQLDRTRPNGLFEDSWGYWQIEPHTRGALVTYAMAARVNLPAFLTRGAERDGLVETLRAVRDRAEQTG
jgi:ribosome-associated toxin RatA of RatAB toxin-antitoxin module